MLLWALWQGLGLYDDGYAVERLQESKEFQTCNCFLLISFRGKKTGTCVPAAAAAVGSGRHATSPDLSCCRGSLLAMKSSHYS